MKKSLCGFIWMTCLSMAFSWSARAEEAEKPAIIVDKARIVVQEMSLSSDKQVPVDFIKKCAGLAIIPGMMKGGFIVGGAYGRGVVLAHRGGTSWSGPAFISITAGSLGFQIGGESVDLLLVIFGRHTMDAFLRSKFKLGGDVALAAGPIGARASAATEITLKGGIYSYSRSKGLFAGVSLEGAAIRSQYDLNKAFYGKALTAKEILSGKTQIPAKAQKLIATLNKVK